MYVETRISNEPGLEIWLVLQENHCKLVRWSWKSYEYKYQRVWLDTVILLSPFPMNRSFHLSVSSMGPGPPFLFQALLKLAGV